jgi:hypothetical protein
VGEEGVERALGVLGRLWSSLLGILGVIAAQALTSFAIVAYFRPIPGASRWRTLVAPLAGGGLTIASLSSAASGLASASWKAPM